MLCLVLSACRGSFEAGQDPEDGGSEAPGNDSGSNSGSANGGGEKDSGDVEVDAGVDPEVDAGAPVEDGGIDIEVDASGFELLAKFASNDQFDDYLTDKDGRALYFYAGDAAGARKATCLTDDGCATQWPPFDWGKQYADIITALKLSENPPAGVMDFDYFHRDDGLFQVTYKNRPLYYHNGDQAQTVTGDGSDNVWFVARDYFVFVRTALGIAPQGLKLQPQGTPYLTDGAGKSIYARVVDVPSTGPQKCTDECLLMWPEWAPPIELNKLPIPSSLDISDFGTFLRTNGAPQIVYKNFPLHYNIGDEEPGETRGQEVGNWRLVAPSGF